VLRYADITCAQKLTNSQLILPLTGDAKTNQPFIAKFQGSWPWQNCHDVSNKICDVGLDDKMQNV